MAKFTRKNAWINGGTFDNPDLLWYARGVGEMQARALNDPNSWWFFAAIHGEYIQDSSGYPGWGFIPPPPAVPITPLPSRETQDTYWNQCQHQSWYFAPWHRGYLVALEAQIRQAIVALGGPADWALPYWNYFGPDTEYEIPPAFTQTNLPDGSPNPLFVEARYGPKNNGDIYVEIPPLSQACQDNTIYTGSNPQTRYPGYGGPETGFHHSGGTSGNLESNPHNKVHTQVGGESPDGTYWGLMSDPGLAALDPIFYLHHGNIDRMWASWNAMGNSNPTDKNWLAGPAASGEREFIMPLPNSTPWVYTPDNVDSLSKMDYIYDDLTTTAAKAVGRLALRLNKLGGGQVANTIGMESMDSGKNPELVGAHDGALTLKNSGARATVRLDSGALKKVSSSLRKASAKNFPDQVYLQIENVRGSRDANELKVSVNNRHAGSVSLFGLRKASQKDGQHGGAGLTLLVDVTDIIDELFINESLDGSALDVRIIPSNQIREGEEITIGRVSLYRQSHS